MKLYSQLARIFTSYTLMTAVALTPAFAFAKDNDNGKGKGNDDDRGPKVAQSIEDKSCLKAIGHLIAPGWIKHNGQLSIGDECDLPFGIGKKFGGDHPTTTPPTVDTTAPVISSVAVNARTTNALVSWMTDERADSTVFFSANNPVDINASGTQSASLGIFTRDHKVELGSLSASTTYHFIVRSRDPSGNTSTSSEMTFTTKASNDVVSPVISNIAAFTSTSSVKIGWTTNENATSKIYYSSSSSIDVNASTTASVSDQALVKSHLLTVSGLSASTTYYFIVESVDAAGNISRSTAFPESTGSTTPVTDTTPPAITNAIAIVSSTTVQLSWVTNEAATAKAYYATSTPIDVTASTTPSVQDASLSLAHSLTVSGLATSTQYHMIIESKDAAGNTSRSNEFSFMTNSGI